RIAAVRVVHALIRGDVGDQEAVRANRRADEPAEVTALDREARAGRRVRAEPHDDVELAVRADSDVMRADTLATEIDRREAFDRGRAAFGGDHLDRARQAEADLGLFTLGTRSDDATVATDADLGHEDVAVSVDGQAARLVQPLGDDGQRRAFR